MTADTRTDKRTETPHGQFGTVQHSYDSINPVIRDLNRSIAKAKVLDV